MTPNEIATDVATLGSAGGENINWSTMATYSWGGQGMGQIPDDQRSWD